MTKEYLVEYRIKNALLFNKIKETKCETILEFCEKFKFSYFAISQFLNLKRTVFKKDGDLDPNAEKLLEFFQAIPDELFPARQFTQKLLENKKTFLANEEDLIQLDNFIGCEPSYDQFQIEQDLVDKDQVIKRLHECLSSLTPREERIIRMRFGINGDAKTLEEISKQFGVSKTRIKNIESRALMKLQDRKRRNFIKTGETMIKTI